MNRRAGKKKRKRFRTFLLKFEQTLKISASVKVMKLGFKKYKTVSPILHSYKSVINIRVYLGRYKLYNKMQPRKLRRWISRSETELGTVCVTITLYI